MTIKKKTAQQLATEHWNWLESIITLPLDLTKSGDMKTYILARYLYTTAFIHGYKHAKDRK